MYSVLAVARITIRPVFEFRRSRAWATNERLGFSLDQWPGQLYVEFTIGNKKHKSRFATGIKTDWRTWQSSRSARPNAEAKLLCKEMMAFETLVNQIADEMQKNKKAITPATLHQEVRDFVSGNFSGVTLERVYDEFMQWADSRLERSPAHRTEESISKATFDTYPKRWAMIHDYLRTNKLLSFPIENVDYPFAFRLKEWLQAQRQANGKPYQPVTINKVISLLKQLMTYALSKGHTKQHALHNFSCRGGSPANPKPLTEAHMDHLETCELPYGLRRFCDSWLVAAELCLHYADFSELASCVFIQREGRRFMQRKRMKQQGRTLMQTVDVTDRAERILAKYGGVKNLAYASSTYYSKVLKQIAEKANLCDEYGQIISLQFGMGRDTGLTLRAIDGANSIQLSKIAGWSKPAYAERYIGGSGTVDIVAAFAEEKERKKALRQLPNTPPDEPTDASPVVAKVCRVTPVTGTPFFRVA